MPAVRPQTLNNVFQQAADQARQKLPELTHNQKVGGRNKNHVALLFRSLRVCNLLFRFFSFFFRLPSLCPRCGLARWLFLQWLWLWARSFQYLSAQPK